MKGKDVEEGLVFENGKFQEHLTYKKYLADTVPFSDVIYGGFDTDLKAQLMTK